ncbi:MAG: 16S rRNA (cytosine(1402)-N(4))-methyltransferase RsmH, partial [Verrucomicrobiales bacterium]
MVTLWLEPMAAEQTWTFHEPVLADEILHWLQPAPGKKILDGTLGGGGHSRVLLEAGAEVIALDRDKEAVAHGAETLREYAGQLRLVHANFREAEEALDVAGISQVDGVLLDLGVSSWQIDTPERGFSFQKDGPLDMRMDGSQGMTAADIVNEWPAEDLAQLIYRYGEEPGSRRVAQAIVARREKHPFRRTLDLAETVARVVRAPRGRHPATRTFQALRMGVNDELGALSDGLHALSNRLAPKGRMAVISFHSLEDRVVKEFFRERSVEWLDQPGWPEPIRNERRLFNRLT